MSTVSVPTFWEAIGCPSTSKSVPTSMGTYSQERAPTDPFFYANVDVQNIVIGSRWMLGYDNAGVFTELVSGEASATNFIISNVPAFGSPFLLELRVRKSSAQPKYKKMNLFGFHSGNGIVMYLSQVLDPVAT